MQIRVANRLEPSEHNELVVRDEQAEEARSAPISALCAASVAFEYERSAVASECLISLAVTTGPLLLNAQSCLAPRH